MALAAALRVEPGAIAEDISESWERLKPVPHRLNWIEGANGDGIIDDSYNANISGERGALEVLVQASGEKIRCDAGNRGAWTGAV